MNAVSTLLRGPGVFEFDMLKNEFTCVCDEGHGGLPDLLFTRSKNSVPSLNYCDFIAVVRFNRNYLEIINFEFQNLSYIF